LPKSFFLDHRVEPLISGMRLLTRAIAGAGYGTNSTLI
jgi:hypothetical protein